MMGFIFMGLIIVGAALAYVKRCDLFKVDCGGGGSKGINISPPIKAISKPLPTVDSHGCKSPSYWDPEYGPTGHCWNPNQSRVGVTDSLYASSRLSYF
jgi:hypothetical protein